MNLLPTFDEEQDAVFSLRMVREMLEKCETHPQYWKWVFVCLHSAVQGVMVLALRISTNVPIMQDGPAERRCICPNCKLATTSEISRSWGTQREWSNYFRNVNESPPPRPPRLAPFLELYERIQSSDYMERLEGSRAFRPTNSQNESVRSLNNYFRNGFIHFLPRTSFLTVKDFLPMITDCIDIIAFLAFDSGNIRGCPDQLESQIRADIAEIKKKVNLFDTAFEAKYRREASDGSSQH